MKVVVRTEEEPNFDDKLLHIFEHICRDFHTIK